MYQHTCRRRQKYEYSAKDNVLQLITVSPRSNEVVCDEIFDSPAQPGGATASNTFHEEVPEYVYGECIFKHSIISGLYNFRRPLQFFYEDFYVHMNVLI